MALPQSVLDKIHRDTEERRASYQQKVAAWEEQQAARQAERIAAAPAEPRNDAQGTGAGQTLMERATSGTPLENGSRRTSASKPAPHFLREDFIDRQLNQKEEAKQTQKSVREYLGLSTPKGSAPEGAPSVRELLEQGRQERAEQIKQYEEEGPRAQSASGQVRDMIGLGAGSAVSGATSAVDFLANLLPRVEGALFDADPEGTLTGRMLKPVTDATGKLNDWAHDTTSKLKEQVDYDTKDSKAKQVAADIVSGVVSAVPNTALALMTAGGSAAGQLAPQAAGLADTARTAVTTMLQNPMYWTSAAQTLGTSYDEAVADGATETEAILAATLSTAFNAAVEVGGGVETLPSEIRNTDLSTAKRALEWLKSALEEGGEEFVQGILERLTNKAVFDEEKLYFSMTDENAVFNPYVSAKEAGMGTAVGGILGGGQVLADTVLNRSAKWNADRLDAAIQETLKPAETPTDRAMLDTFQQLQGQENGGNLDAAFQTILDENAKKLNIDNTESKAYNGINENGGAFDGRNNQLDGASGEGVRTGRDGGWTDSAVETRGGLGRGNLSNAGIVLLSPEAQQTLTERGIVNVELHDSSMDNTAFSAALDAARAADGRNGWAVTPKDANELTEAGTRTFLDRNGSAGFAIATDGDIEAVFANKTAGAPKGATKSTIPQAIANGGNKLDCYGSKLVDIYSRYGFVPVARVTFNPEYANPGWTADKGMPDIYFMMHNGDSADAVVQNMGKYKSWSKAELDALPLMEYDEAYRYRDSLMNGGKNGVWQVEYPGGGSVGDLGAKTSAFRHEVVQNQGKTTPDYYEQNNIPEEGRNENVHTVIHEDESLHNARVRLEQDYDGEIADLKSKATWSGEEMDMGQMVKDDLRAEAEETGDWAKFREWDKVCEEHKSEAGRSLQALAKQNRNTVDQILHDSSEYLDNAKRGTDTDAVMQTVSEYANRYENAVSSRNVDELLRIIKETARTRKTGFYEGKLGALSKPLDWALNRIAGYAKTGTLAGAPADVAQTITAANITDPRYAMSFLESFAANSIRGVAADQQKASVGKMAMTIRRNGMLSKFATAMRNFDANGVFDIVDSVARDISVPMDMLLSKITGTRSVAIDRSYFSKAKWRGTMDGLAMAMLETSLDVNARNQTSKYENSSQRTFKMSGGVVSKCMSLWEESMGFRMYVTDEMSKGGTSAEIQRGLDKLYEQRKITDDSLRDGGAQEALYRTFQDDTALSRVSTGARNVANILHVGDVGLGDMALPFAQVPANLADRVIDYSPAGLAESTYRLADVLIKAKKGTLTAAEQAKAVQNIGRNITGSGLIAIAAALAAKGIIRVANPGGEDENKDKAAFEKMQGQDGTQINLSAMMRAANGESADWQNGDTLMSIAFLEPFNAHLTIGAMIAEDLEAEGQLTASMAAKDSLAGSLASILDLPMFEKFQDAYYAYSYSNKERTGEKLLDAANTLAANEAASFIPNAWKGVAQGLDPYQRNLYSKDNAWGQAADQFRAVFDRDSLPAYQDSFGRDMENEGGALNFLNTNILPGQITTYKTDDVLDKITDLSELTGKTSVYPTRQAPGSITVDGEAVPLDTSQQREYQQIYGKTEYDTRAALFDNAYYDGQDQNTMLKANEYAEDCAKQTAKDAMNVGFEPDDWVAELEGKSPEEVADAIMLKTFESLALDKKKYESKYDGLGDMLETGKIDDTIAISLCSESLQEAYYNGPSAAGITAQQWIDAYSYAASRAEDDSTESKRAAVVEYANSLDITKTQRTALVNGMHSVMPDIILKDAEAPNDFLLAQGQDGIKTIEANMSDSQRESYETYIKGNVDMATYLDVWEFKGSARSDYDQNGKTIKSAQEKVIERIDQVGRTSQEKRNLFLAMGYSDKNCPW